MRLSRKLAITALIIAATWYYNQVSEITLSYHNGQAGYSVKANFGKPYFIPKEADKDSVKNRINRQISSAVSFLEKKIKEEIPVIKEKFSENFSKTKGKVYAEEKSAKN